MRCTASLAAIVAALALAGAAQPIPGEQAMDAAQRYRMRIDGASRALRRDMLAVSTTWELRRRPPASVTQLRRRTDRDAERFERVLRVHGFYGGQVSVRIEAEGDPVRVIFVVASGVLYRIAEVTLSHQDHAAAPAAGPRLVAPLQTGDPATAPAIRAAEAALRRQPGGQGFPFADVVDRTVTVHHARQSVDVRFAMNLGPWARFGPTAINGPASVRERYLRQKLPWQAGDAFDSDLLRLAQRRLTSDGLFLNARIFTDDALTADGAVPIRIELVERAPRTIALGAGFRSDEGFGGHLSWEHRNLAGQAERLTLMLEGSEIGWSGEARVRIPDVGRFDRHLMFSGGYRTERTDAYASRGIRTLTAVQQHRPNGWTLGAGLGFREARLDGAEDSEAVRLLSVPLSIDGDRGDSLLDPRRGYRVSAGATPCIQPWIAGGPFVQVTVGATHYRALLEGIGLDWAGRIRAGSIQGAGHAEIPADERFYVGGSGTLRGYAYQSVGPRDGDRPLGGLSFWALSSEWRWRATRTLGGVVFVDGAAAQLSRYGTGNDPARWGVGVGFRYYTPIGPLRLDVAVPTTRAEHDAALQVYISIGQAY